MPGIGKVLPRDTTMTVQLDQPLRRPAAATAAPCPSSPVPYNHPAIRVRLAPRPVAQFEVTAAAVASRLTLLGELDLAGIQLLRDAVTAILARNSAEVVVDLARLRFIDAGGIGLLVELRTELAARGATLRILNPHTRVGRVFALCGLDAMLAMPVATSAANCHSTDHRANPDLQRVPARVPRSDS